MRFGLACLAIAAVVIAGIWTWLGAPALTPHFPWQAGEKLYCISYAPFRGSQTPLDPTTRISAAQIDEDLTRLAQISNCVRTYSTDYGLDQIAGIAARHGLKVLQGLWLSSHPEKNREQIDTAVALANRYPDTIRAVVVGNEVLLRGELSATDLTTIIREVKAKVRVAVTYADVWEFWMRNRDVASAVDFITIHILPYWEDIPVPASEAATHVRTIRQQVVDAFPGKEVIIGEVGWPSAGRMREGALPSRANQARVIQDVLDVAKTGNFKVNVIEAFDAPWKRALEGTVGGHWGLFDDASRSLKYPGKTVSNHPYWQWQAAGGVVLAILIFVVAIVTRGKDAEPRAWLAVTLNAIAAGVLVGWAVENAPVESLGVGGWVRSLAMIAVAVVSPFVLTRGVMKAVPMPALARLFGPVEWRTSDRLAQVMAGVLVATLLLGLLVALGLVFDPRYRDFPFAPMTAAIVPLLTHSLVVRRAEGRRGAAEIGGTILLALSVIYIVPNESLANWQSLWLCATFAALALTLWRVRGVPG
ncbi:beta-(1-6) glucans synthase [Pseudolabrys taiwanensis]|uniref:glycoside hydrolase family 17 protein n=1 Tax=Pseudolabrys taiwanensis TaxID=331696 RepID=UPI001AECE687|nr:beta-(1-6) glucans synthase [Pseudolabrys taiwanensis]